MTKKPCTSPVLAGLPPNNSPIAVLADVRTGNHWVEGFDRVVFDFRDDTSMPGFSVRYVDKVLEDPSGIPVPMLPGAKLLVSMRLATAHEHGVSTVPPGDRDLRPDLPRVRQVKVAGDYEGMLTYGIAVGAARGPAAFRAHALTRNRLVIDVAHARTRQQAWFCGQVYFADQRKLVDGTDPPVTAV
jgi:hypothetical protein